MMQTITFYDAYSNEMTTAPIVNQVPAGYEFDCWEQDYNRPLSKDNYYRLYMLNYTFVALPAPEQF